MTEKEAVLRRKEKNFPGKVVEKAWKTYPENRIYEKAKKQVKRKAFTVLCAIQRIE